MLMSLALAVALSLQPAPQPIASGSIGLTQGIVRICDRDELDCQEFQAADLERQAQPNRSLAASGQRIFLDPHSGQITEPTLEQLEELQSLILVDEYVAAPAEEEVRVETLPDGSVKADVRHLAVYHRATILEAEPPAPMCVAGPIKEEGRP